MQVSDSKLMGLSATRLQRSSSHESPGNAAVFADDVHLSELVRSLRWLAADSPERQAHIDRIARSLANGSYSVDANATAGKIIDDTLRRP
jgi:anti-sigma28 factor (negative regulator of flagellin synthesis)